MARPAKNLVGEKFGRLLVLERNGSRGDHAIWKCLCDCGKKKDVVSYNLIRGQTKSCGCYALEKSTKHGKSNTPTYIVWRAIQQRCYVETNDNYKYYGGKGIKVCERWLQSFENFYIDMGERPNGMTLDRINTELDYSPENCRWVNWRTQTRNKSNNVNIEMDGEIKCLTDWANEYSISVATVKKRIDSGWDYERAIKTKPRKINREKKKTFIVDGEILSMSEIASKYDIALSTLYNRASYRNEDIHSVIDNYGGGK